MNKFIINGVFYAQKSTGVHRFARELMLELDKFINKDEIVIVIPKYVEDIPKFNNIKIEKFGVGRPIIWEQTYLIKYLLKSKTQCISLCNTLPLLRPGIMCIHDAAYKLHPEYFNTIHGKISCIWHRIHYRIAILSKKPIITVSYFSKYQIIDSYKINPNRIHVIGNAWQHMNRIGLDDNIIKNNNLEIKNYFFTLGNISKNKNTKWVYDVAKKNPQYTFVVCGKKAKGSNERYEDLKNLINIGYVSDEEIKSLFKYCKAFIFPSIHEGFGIPPMEALSQGSQIIISNTTSLPEIYKSCAHYIDPYDTNVNLDNILNEKVISGNEVLSRYSWKKSANMLYDLILSLEN